MPQLNVTVSEEVLEIISMLVEESGESKSGLASRLIDKGLLGEVERYNRLKVFRSLKQKSEKEIMPNT